MRYIAILVCAALTACNSNQATEYNNDLDNMVAADAGAQTDTPRQPSTDDGFAISAPSDPGATYRILRIERMANGNLEVVSRRDGSSGTSFARREISCSDYSYRYLGEGDNLKDAEEDGPNPGELSALTGTSASSDVAKAACAKRI